MARDTLRIDLTRPVTNRAGHSQNYVTLNEPNLGDLIECQEAVGYIFGSGIWQEAINWPALAAYLKRLLVDVSYEVLATQAHPRDGARFVDALRPFMPGAPANAAAPSESSSSASG